MANNSIYKVLDKHIDLERINAIDDFNEGLVEFFIWMQLTDSPIVICLSDRTYDWFDDYEKGLKNEHTKLLKAWNDYKNGN